MEATRQKRPKDGHGAVRLKAVNLEATVPQPPSLGDFGLGTSESSVTVVDGLPPPVFQESNYNVSEDLENDKKLSSVGTSCISEDVNKSMEAIISSSNFPLELPLDALLPRSNSREENTQASASSVDLLQNISMTGSSVYSDLTKSYSSFVYPPPAADIALPRISIEAPIVSEPLPTTLPPAYQEAKYPEIVTEDSAPSRERLQQLSGEVELMSKSHLLEYYKNSQLNFVKDFVDEFVEQELEPRNCLHELLARFKEVCERLQRNDDLKSTTAKILSTLNNEVWLVEEQRVAKRGKCGDDRSAYGEAMYKVAHMKPEKLVALQLELNKLNESELDQALCLEIRSRALALQIQWIVVDVNNRFLVEHQLSPSSIPILLSTLYCLPSRKLVKESLSDLFDYLRFPMLPPRVRESINGWIVELGSVLLKACTTDDQMFLLCQILRSPSPLSPWAIPLIQTFITSPSLNLATAMNSFVALMSILMNPIKHREQFLSRVTKFYTGDDTWDLVDDEGDLDNTHIFDLTETDLIQLLAQFSIRPLFSICLKHFTFIHQGNRLQVLLSLVSFTLVLLKICDEGLDTYSTLKNFCKKICDYMRRLIQYFCNYWDLTKHELRAADRALVQNEVNRIVLQALYYIASKKTVSLWQFLIDFPYGSLTDICRLRCQLLLRNVEVLNVHEVYKIPDEQLIERIKSGGALVDHLKACSKEDGTYNVLALASIISYCTTEQQFFALEIIHLCFLDENTREVYYKVGSEAISVLIERNPSILSTLLKYIDRQVDHLDEYAIDILTSSTLSNCELSVEDVGNLLGKWLINRPISHPASHIARRVLCSTNWGESGSLWLPQEVHDVCADNLVKAHIVHCKGRNSSIAKSVAKATKMAMKCPDLEQQFDKFCWDVLIKLKVSAKPLAPNPTNDLTAFFLFIQQKCLTTPDIFMDIGLKYFTELINSSSFNPAAVILSQLVSNFPNRLHIFTANATFRDDLYRLLHADESSYAIQLIIGADKFPGPCLSLISSAITYQLQNSVTVEQKKKLSLAWLSLLTCPKLLDWNADKFVIFLVGTITGLAFLIEPDTLFGMSEVVEKLYKAQIQVWKDSSKGPLSWFSSSQAPPPILANELLSTSPWATYLLLKAEPKVYTFFYEALENSLGKHPQRSLDEAVRKAGVKSHMFFSVDRLHYYRWLQLAVLPEIVEHEMYPLVLQQLSIHMFARKEFEKKQHCPGLRYLKCPASESMFNKLRNEVLPKAEKSVSTSSAQSITSQKEQKLTSFYRAVSQWLFTESVYDPSFSNFHDLILDYLLQMTISGDCHPWMEFVESAKVRQSLEEELKLFSQCCHLKRVFVEKIAPNSPTSARADSLTKLFSVLDLSLNENVLFPVVPLHQGLPVCEKMYLHDTYNMTGITAKFSQYLEGLNKTAKTFITGKEAVETLNNTYLELFQVSAEAIVDTCTYDQSVADKMNENRRKREEEISRLLMIVDVTAIQCAHLEHICSHLCDTGPKETAFKVGDQIRVAGVNLFYRICNSVATTQLLFPAGLDCYEVCLSKLGKAFISENSAEQLNLMRVVLGGNPLNHFLVQNFTPHCIAPEMLFQLYSELSNSMRNASTSEASLSLLSRLDIEHAGYQMPANHFSALMPVIFENMASVTGTSPLRQMCIEHFVHSMFHHFPLNFATGLRLILSACDSQAVPVEIFSSIAGRIDLDALLAEEWSGRVTSKKLKFTADQSLECVHIISEQLGNSRLLLSTRLYSVWSQYLEVVCKLADYFLRSVVFHKFQAELTTVAIEKELRDAFYLLVSVWAPLLEPVNSGLAPWNAADNQLAGVLLDKFVGFLNWLPHCTYLPPGAETVEALLWQYFTANMIGLQRAGTAHIFSIYEVKLVRLNWARFWPNLLDLATMESALVEGPTEIAPLIVELLVRFPWLQLIQHQANQPEDAHKAFHSLLLSIFAHCVYRNVNYAKSRASMENLLKMILDNCQWHYVKVEVIEKTGAFMVASFPNDCFLNPNEVLKTFMCIWRETCFFSTVSNARVSNSAADDLELVVNRKRGFYIRTFLRLMLKSTMDKEDQMKFYKEIIGKTNQFFTSNDKVNYLCLAKQLTEFWPEIPKDKQTDMIMKTLTDWLSEHSESSMVLLVLNTAMESMAASNIPLGLKLLDSCVQIYFQRRLSCEWTEVSQWIEIPERSKEWLYTIPRSDSSIQPCFFVLNAYLMKEMSQLRSSAEECRLTKRIADYIQSIKPKYITSEPAFLLCVEKWLRMLLRQFSNGVSPTVANEEIDVLSRWLHRVHTEEKSVSFFSAIAKFGRKPAFPIKLQLLCNVMDLYIAQQQTSHTQLPRLGPQKPVLNSRIHAFRELQQQKAFLEFGVVLTTCLPFFSQPEANNLHQAIKLFETLAQGLYPEEKVLRKIA